MFLERVSGGFEGGQRGFEEGSARFKAGSTICYIFEIIQTHPADPPFFRTSLYARGKTPERKEYILCLYVECCTS